MYTGKKKKKSLPKTVVEKPPITSNTLPNEVMVAPTHSISANTPMLTV